MAQIDKPNLHFNTKLYTGNGGTQSISSVGFQPDWVWIKSRTQAVNHYGFDAVRGATKGLSQNIANAESTRDSTWFNSFDSDGFTIGSEANINNNSSTYASWNWKAGNSAGSSNSDGSITSTVSANTTAGFSIVSFTGTGANGTVGHGLGQTPAMIIQKNLSITSAWSVWHKSFSGSQVIYLNETGPVGTNTSSWNSTVPTSSVFSVGTGSYPNGSGNGQIYYVFAEKKGFSKFGTYTGNGNADGTFVYTGFKPAFVIAKMSSGTDDWRMVTQNVNSRNTISNEIDKNLYAHSNSAETDTSIDFVSNGMKIRSSSGGINGSGSTFIYMAFAAEPLVGTNNTPATAR